MLFYLYLMTISQAILICYIMLTYSELKLWFWNISQLKFLNVFKKLSLLISMQCSHARNVHIQSDPLDPSKATARPPVYLHCCAYRCARVWLWRHGSFLRRSSVCMWSLFGICILLCQWIIISGICVYETTFSDLIFTVHFILSFWLSFYKTIK